MDPEVYYLAGLIKQARDLAEEAEAFFLKASYLNPDHYESLVQLCLLSERKGDSNRSNQYRNRMRRLQARHRGKATEAKANV
jgi:chemotaxis protein methyltransferase WspC